MTQIPTIYEDTNPRKLIDLLSEIDAGNAVLPDFQRNFVWDPGAVAGLIISVANRYPAGSILRVRNAQNHFRWRHFAEAPSGKTDRPTFLVLDGQQRLTSLYQAFYGCGDHRFYLDFKAFLDGKEIDDDVVCSYRQNHPKVKELGSADNQFEKLILPLSTLRGGNGDVTKWITTAAHHHAGRDIDKLIDLQAKLNKVVDRWINPIRTYEFPVVTLSDKTDAEAICTIFETLNRTGVRLTPFELLTARFFTKSNNLRDLWEVAQQDNPILVDYEIDPYSILQAITLRKTDPNPTCKRGLLMKLESKDIDEHWTPVVGGLAKGLEILRDDCGVLSPRWIPYTTMLVPLMAVLAKLPLGNSPNAVARRAKLVRWFWCTSLMQQYDSAANTRASDDYLALVNYLTSDNKAPDQILNFKFDVQLLWETTPKQRARYNALIYLAMKSSGKMTKERARDFHTGETITGALLVQHGIDDHHIFPDNYLQKIGGKKADFVDTILNRTLIDAKTNKIISDNAPSIYLEKIEKTGIDFTSLMGSHLIPADKSDVIWKDNYEEFLKARLELFQLAISDATGHLDH